ncbi:MAG TPA: glutaredoxin family protein [Candidatus Limnocylindrales bacterium]|nr:glutaredoxin family protein [Candidatus Limnocylindrales bacterium]
MVKVTIYTKKDCCLCETAKEVIKKVQADYPTMEIYEVDVTSDTDLYQRFQYEIPVVFIENEKAFRYKVSEKLLRKKLNRILQRGV